MTFLSLLRVMPAAKSAHCSFLARKNASHMYKASQMQQNHSWKRLLRVCCVQVFACVTRSVAAIVSEAWGIETALSKSISCHAVTTSTAALCAQLGRYMHKLEHRHTVVSKSCSIVHEHHNELFRHTLPTSHQSAVSVKRFDCLPNSSWRAITLLSCPMPAMQVKRFQSHSHTQVQGGAIYAPNCWLRECQAVPSKSISCELIHEPWRGNQRDAEMHACYSERADVKFNVPAIYIDLWFHHAAYWMRLNSEVFGMRLLVHCHHSDAKSTTHYPDSCMVPIVLLSCETLYNTQRYGLTIENLKLIGRFRSGASNWIKRNVYTVLVRLRGLFSVI